MKPARQLPLALGVCALALAPALRAQSRNALGLDTREARIQHTVRHSRLRIGG